MSRFIEQDLPRWPCGTCKRKCHLNSILCGCCDSWFHGHCQGLSQVSIAQLTDISVDYVCRKCSRPNGPFDFNASLRRLSNAAEKGYHNLQSATILEAILIGDSPVPEPECDVDVHQRRDRIASQILNDHRLGTDHYPAATRMDGNCFYHALSQRLIGSNDLSTEFRVRITIDLVNRKRDNIKVAHQSQIKLVSPDYDTACLNAATNAGYACLWTFQSAANILNRPIRSVYPPVNGLSDICVEIMNRTFHPIGPARSKKDTMMVMWTSMHRPVKRKTWTPDHFVPLIPFYRAPEEVILDDSLQKTPPSRKLTYAEVVSPKGPSRVTKTATDSVNVLKTGIDLTPPRTAATGHVLPTLPTNTGKDPLSSKRKLPTPSPISDTASEDKTPNRSITTGTISPQIRNGPLGTSTPKTSPHVSKTSTKEPKPALSHFWTDHNVDTKPQVPITSHRPDTSSGERTKLSRQHGVSRLKPSVSKKPKLWRPFSPETDDTISHENLSSSSDSPKRKNVRQNTSQPDILESPVFKGRHTSAKVVVDRQYDTIDNTSQPDRLESPVFKGQHTPANVFVDRSRQTTGKLSQDRFLDVDIVIDYLTDAATHLDAILRGKKEDVFFIIDNQQNNERRNAGKKAYFTDDCGAWNLGSTKTHFYLRQDGKLVYVEKKDGQFYTLRSKIRESLNPQPNETELIKLKRYYTKLKRSRDYKKRISWLESGHVYLVEYIGEAPEDVSHHGNAKMAEREYIRCAEPTKTNIREKIKTQTSREVYQDMVLDDSGDVPRNLKQVQNMKFHQQRTERRDANVRSDHRQNTADDVLSVINDLHDNPFVQQINHSKGQAPEIILYLPEQIDDIRKMCTAGTQHQSVLGIDRTFNLAACYVTILVYKNTNLVRSSTQTHPIMLGPVFLHWNGSYLSYFKFFSHIKSLLETDVNGTEISGESLIIGSDEEKAILKAVRHNFPTSDHVLCTRHLEENMRRQLTNKIGANSTKQREIQQKIFGKSGLLQATDETDFDLRVIELLDEFEENLPAFVEYFRNLSATIRNHVFLPHHSNNDNVPLDWKNNACESMNHLLKLSTNWKTLKIPDLIERLHKIVKFQYAEIRRALHGQGNYELAPWMRHLRVSQQSWEGKTSQQKDALLKKVLRGVSAKPTRVTSTDGKLTIPRTPLTAKKPGQRKRVKTAKTVSFLK